jgi:diguanylate cyclase
LGIRALSAPYIIGGREVRIGVSIGIALAPKDGVTLDRLAAGADAALYRAKDRGRGSIVFASEPSAPPSETATAA